MASALRSHLITFVVGGLLGAVAGAFGMLIAFPFLFPPAPAADALPTLAASATSPAATFRFDESAPGRDSVHWANGSGSVLKTDAGWVLRLEGDFKAGPGPNYWIYLNTRAVGEEKDFTADGQRVRLAKLRAFEGAQNYALPPDIDPGKFHTITIWCESFSQYIGSGALKRAPSASRLPGAAPA